jgi:hypothetical protein
MLGLIPADAATAAPTAPAIAARHRPVDLPGTGAKKATCYDQITGQTDLGIAIVSQVMYDIELVANAADDFACKGKKGKKTRLKKIDFIGLYYGTHDGPADSFNVRIWRDDKDELASSEPDDTKEPVCEYLEHAYKGLGKGSLDPTHGRIKFGADDPPCKVKNRKTYWLEIQAVMAIGQGGQFGWELGDLPRIGANSDWRNPDDTYSTRCTTYSNDRSMASCIGFNGNPLFTVN